MAKLQIPFGYSVYRANKRMIRFPTLVKRQSTWTGGMVVRHQQSLLDMFARKRRESKMTQTKIKDFFRTAYVVSSHYPAKKRQLTLQEAFMRN